MIGISRRLQFGKGKLLREIPECISSSRWVIVCSDCQQNCKWSVQRVTEESCTSLGITEESCTSLGIIIKGKVMQKEV
jgi:hypothetical protein